MSEAKRSSLPPTETLGEKRTASDDATSPAPTPSHRLGRYTVTRHLGSGGMGEVFAAHDPELDREVAIKLIRTGFADESFEARARFRREARALARLSHPNVVTIFDVGLLDTTLFVAMELVDGPTLGAWLARPRSWREILNVFMQAGRGLEAAHDAGIVHRDFKPSNVMVGDRVRVVDFGLARTAYSAESHPGPARKLLCGGVTQTGDTLGTPAYMAPEQLENPIASPLADQYSFALVLREALAGKGTTEIPSTVPRWLRAIVTRALSPRPESRYPSMGHLLADVARGLGRSPRAGRLAAAAAMLAVAFFAGAMAFGAM